MFKIPPSLYLKRMARAQTPAEWIDANTGLFNLFVRHANYWAERYRQSFARTL